MPGRRLLLAVAIVRDDIFPFAGVRSSYDSHHRLGVAHIENLVRQAWLNVDEVACLVLDRFLALTRLMSPFYSSGPVRADRSLTVAALMEAALHQMSREKSGT